jgi:NADH-quinone oxidoreductase subunit N
MLESSFPTPTGLDFLMVGPMIIVLVTGIVAMMIELFNPKKPNNPIIAVCLLGLAAAAAMLVPQFQMGSGETMVGMVIRDQFSLVIQLLLVVTCFLTLLFSEPYLRSKKIPFAEFYPLLVWATAGGMLMATSKNLLVIFIGLEMLSISLYVLAGMSRRENKSEESAMKYFLLGAFSTGFFVYGIAMFYGATGSLQLATLAQAFGSGKPEASLLLLFGFGLMMVGLGFKSAFVPFHQWTPDVYQGAPTNVTAFMAVASKIAAIAALFRVIDAAIPMQHLWMPAMTVIAMLTMVVGNVVALVQKDVKRILGYSSIAHAGYILVGILAYAKSQGQIGTGSILYYLLSYGLMTMGAFAVVTIFSTNGKEGTTLNDLRGLSKRAPLAAFALLIFMVSLIGIPPFAGFFGKFLIFRDAMSTDLQILAITLAASSIASVAYYLQIAWAAFVSEDNAEEPPLKMNLGMRTTAIICAVGIILAGVLFNPVQRFLTGESEPVMVTASEVVAERGN